MSSTDEPPVEPAADAPEPAGEAPADAPEPAAEAPEPAADAPEPAAEAPEPAADAPEPAAEAPEPAADAPEPAAEAPEPADDGTDAGEPSADRAEPPAEEAATEAPARPPETPVDDPYRVLLDALAVELGDGLVETHAQRGDLWVRVRADAWRRTAEVCRDHLGFDYFCYLSGIDWLPHTWPNPKVEEGNGADAGEADDEAVDQELMPDAEPEPEAEAAPADGRKWQTGYAGGDTRFQVLARLYSTTRHLGITFKADLDDDSPAVETWSSVYAGANWHEREAWEMYGFDFPGHPNLIHLYLPSAFEGFPLRKDFPLLAREVKPWPGLVDVEPFPPGAEEESSGDEAATTTGAEGADG